MATAEERDLEVLLKTEERFPPPPEFAEQANASDPSIYDEADKDFEAFGAEWAEKLDWFEKWDTVLEWNLPFAKWFVGGKINACTNCLDRHVKAGKAKRRAIIWEGEPGDVRTLTYGELLEQVCKLANALKSLGIKKG